VSDAAAAVAARLDALAPEGALGVAVSGGGDSAALLEAAVDWARDRGRRVEAATVDHRLRPEAAGEARAVAARCAALGVPHEILVWTDPPRDGGNLPAKAREARLGLLTDWSARRGLAAVALGHTLDDQAETVLLGLGRGSGARSLAGMRPVDPPWVRPLLSVQRETTEAACRAQGLVPWSDPHNVDPKFTRVRLRTEVLPLLEEVLQGGVAEALARTARQLQDDTDALDVIGAEVLRRVRVPEGLDPVALQEVPAAVRRRVLRDWLRSEGVGELTDAHLREADALVANWRGQGGPALPGDFVLRRAHGRLHVETAGRKPPNG
jgi:tRNA(Ile)-lysidine synthase